MMKQQPENIAELLAERDGKLKVLEERYRAYFEDEVSGLLL